MKRKATYPISCLGEDFTPSFWTPPVDVASLPLGAQCRTGTGGSATRSRQGEIHVLHFEGQENGDPPCIRSGSMASAIAEASSTARFPREAAEAVSRNRSASVTATETPRARGVRKPIGVCRPARIFWRCGATLKSRGDDWRESIATALEETMVAERRRPCGGPSPSIFRRARVRQKDLAPQAPRPRAVAAIGDPPRVVIGCRWNQSP
jgi:hypothetical protein